MEIDELIKLAQKRWTAREFKTDPVSEEDLNKILEAGRWSPSGANTQPWELIVIKDTDTKEKMAELFVDAKEKSKEKDKDFPFESSEALRKRIMNPPVLIAVCVDTRLKQSYPKYEHPEYIINSSIGSLIQTMMLAAASLDLSLSWGTQITFSQEKLKELLGVPDYLWIPEVLQLGYPAGEKHETTRREIDEFVHREKLDESKVRSDEEIEELLSSRVIPDIYSGT